MSTTTPLIAATIPVASGTDQVPADLATALDTFELFVIPRFSSVTAANTAYTASGYTLADGMERWIVGSGKQRYNGTAAAWLFVPDAPIEVFGQGVNLTLNANGQVAITHGLTVAGVATTPTGIWIEENMAYTGNEITHRVVASNTTTFTVLFFLNGAVAVNGTGLTFFWRAKA